MHALSGAWVVTLVFTVVGATGLCLVVRRRPELPATIVNDALALLLVVVSGLWMWTTMSGRFSVVTSLPLPLCDLATLVAAAALVTRNRLLVELTYFWGLAGTLQALLTPDLSAPFPGLVFFEYVLAHAGIVCAALVLVAGEGIAPGKRAVPRVFAVTAAYTAIVGLADWATGGDYMYLRRPPSSWTLLDVLGPWPWYIVSAAAVALVLFEALDAPFALRRLTARASPRAPRPPRSRLRPLRSR